MVEVIILLKSQKKTFVAKFVANVHRRVLKKKLLTVSKKKIKITDQDRNIIRVICKTVSIKCFWQ